MTSGAIARRYGRALFDLASEANEVAATGNGLAELACAVSGVESGVLAPGVLSAAQSQQVADALVAKVGAGSLLGRFLAVVAANGRLGELPAIHARYQQLEDEAAGRVRALVKAAAPLSDAERVALREKFETVLGRKVIETVEVDPQLLGGVTVEAAGRVYDGSIRTQLARLERRMAG